MPRRHAVTSRRSAIPTVAVRSQVTLCRHITVFSPPAVRSQMTLCRHVTVFSRHVTVFSRHVTVFSRHVAVFSRHVATFSRPAGRSPSASCRCSVERADASRRGTFSLENTGRHAPMFCRTPSTFQCLLSSACSRPTCP